MLDYKHIYNTSQPDLPYNLCSIESKASNVALYVNDEFKTTLKPNSGGQYSFNTIRPAVPNKFELVNLLVLGTIKADDMSLLNRKSVFNDKNYCLIKKTITTPIDVEGTSNIDSVLIPVNSIIEGKMGLSDGNYIDYDTDFFKVIVTEAATYQMSFNGIYASYKEIEIYRYNGTTYSYVGRGYNWNEINTAYSKYLSTGTYAIRVRVSGSYGTSIQPYTFTFNKLGVTPTLHSIFNPVRYLKISNGQLLWSETDATKFYFNPEVFNLPELYMKLYGSVPLDKELNNLFSVPEQLSMINQKVISFSENENLSTDNIASITTQLNNSRFVTSGAQSVITVSSNLSLDSHAKYNDTIKLVSDNQELVFKYLPNQSTTVHELDTIPSQPISNRIFHFRVRFINPNINALFSFPLLKGSNSLSIIYPLPNGQTYTKVFSITRL